MKRQVQFLNEKIDWTFLNHQKIHTSFCSISMQVCLPTCMAAVPSPVIQHLISEASAILYVHKENLDVFKQMSIWAYSLMGRYYWGFILVILVCKKNHLRYYLKETCIIGLGQWMSLTPLLHILKSAFNYHYI